MKATALKTTLGGGTLALALFGGAALFSAPASAGAARSLSQLIANNRRSAVGALLLLVWGGAYSQR